MSVAADMRLKPMGHYFRVARDPTRNGPPERNIVCNRSIRLLTASGNNRSANIVLTVALTLTNYAGTALWE